MPLLLTPAIFTIVHVAVQSRGFRINFSIFFPINFVIPFVFVLVIYILTRPIMSDHKQIFLTLYGKDEGGRMNISSGNVYMIYKCRICQMTIISEADWIQHLLSDCHQSIHRNHQLLRKVLWDLDRTIAITNAMGTQKRNILNYLIQCCGCQVVDFSYLSAMDGGTACCYALLSSMWVRNCV